jgi:predicted outer membrane lipoprotein
VVPIVEVLAAAFAGIIRAIEAEKTEAARIKRAKREILALSLRVSSDALLRRLLSKGSISG